MSIFNHNGKEIFYELEGTPEKPKLLILNGIMMSTRSWIPFMKTLKEHFQVLRMDFYDQGQSHKLVGKSYTHEIQIDLLKDLLDYLSIPKINIVGISYGGNAALAFACKYQERVERLMLFNSAAYTTPWLKDIGDGWIKAGETRNPDLYYKVTIPTIYSEKYYEEKLEWMKAREKVLAPVFSNPDFLDAMERLTRSAEPYDVREQLEQLDLPVMIVSAENDTLTPVKEQEYLFKHIKNANWIKLPEVGHASMYENPLIFTSLITGFFLVKDTIYVI
ncbi:MAG: alpha/beta hydrolase [Bacilli bacterium]|nr:alpha/beta hydrolase [Bacilli bacterium]MBN2876236.1 alpha/beta hydrolase [Bacilli bacterium]